MVSLKSFNPRILFVPRAVSLSVPVSQTIVSICTSITYYPYVPTCVILDAFSSLCLSVLVTEMFAPRYAYLPTYLPIFKYPCLLWSPVYMGHCLTISFLSISSFLTYNLPHTYLDPCLPLSKFLCTLVTYLHNDLLIIKSTCSLCLGNFYLFSVYISHLHTFCIICILLFYSFMRSEKCISLSEHEKDYI